MCSFSYIFALLMSTKRNCWRSINNFAGSISFSNEKEDDDSSEDDARTTLTARVKAFTLLLLLLDVAAPFRDTIFEDVFPPEREQRLRFNRGAFTRATGVALFAEGAEFAEAREDGFATVKDIVFIIIFALLFSTYDDDKNA